MACRTLREGGDGEGVAEAYAGCGVDLCVPIGRDRADWLGCAGKRGEDGPPHSSPIPPIDKVHTTNQSRGRVPVPPRRPLVGDVAGGQPRAHRVRRRWVSRGHSLVLLHYLYLFLRDSPRCSHYIGPRGRLPPLCHRRGRRTPRDEPPRALPRSAGASRFLTPSSVLSPPKRRGKPAGARRCVVRKRPANPCIPDCTSPCAGRPACSATRPGFHLLTFRHPRTVSRHPRYRNRGGGGEGGEGVA